MTNELKMYHVKCEVFNKTLQTTQIATHWLGAYSVLDAIDQFKNTYPDYGCVVCIDCRMMDK